MRNIDDKRKEKIIREMEEEESVIQMCKIKKVSQDKIEETVNRLYSEAERRKLTRENKFVEEDRENTPSKYRKSVVEQQYNFAVILLFI
jgi:hypothetical protein